MEKGKEKKNRNITMNQHVVQEKTILKPPQNKTKKG